MTAQPPSSSGGAARRGQDAPRPRRRRRSVRRPQPVGGLHKELGWAGVRERLWGGWAAEIRMPRSRSRVWIGRFDSSLQAALAYDAALFCFYGERVPHPRRFNFPAAPRPGVPEYMRPHLTVANIKAIAENYTRNFGPVIPPQMIYPPAVPAPLLQPPPPAGSGGGAAGGAGATAATDNRGSENGMDGDLLTSAAYLMSCNPDEFAGAMDVDRLSGEY